jgi:hypothetical protein
MASSGCYGVTDSHQAATLEELLRIADLHLFQAKREGRNQIVLDGADATQAADDHQLNLYG